MELKDGSTVAIIGGGPAGAFLAIHLLRKARELHRRIAVIIFERRRPASLQPLANLPDCWKGCNYCAGGISPKLSDVLKELSLRLPEEVVQSRIDSITIQGFWKNIELEVPPGREMLSVYRGSRPDKRSFGFTNFDSFLLDEALEAGASLICGEVLEVNYHENGKPVIRHQAQGSEALREADLVAFAAGVNEDVGLAPERSRMLQCFRRLAPRFRPPLVRRALIFELQARPAVPPSLVGTVHFVEYGSASLPLEMCSLVPKRGFVTVVLVGASVDAATTRGETQEIMKQFLELPHIRKLISPTVQLTPACICRPNMVIGSAKHPYGDRVAAVGDIVTARLYKDGILSAQQTAQALAETVLTLGVDAASLKEGYWPTLRRFRADNRFAALVFVLHRIFFSSSILSRILYQAVITERKSTPAHQRHLEKILWKIASGDANYRDIFLEMVQPATVWSVLTGGAVITLRNYLTEIGFGLRWEGFGRFTTGVAMERLEEKRHQFSRLMADASVEKPGKLEFERMYKIKIAAPRHEILDQLGRFGEPDRGYLRPRWLKVQRTAGAPNAPGCVIRYEVGTRRCSFNLMLEQLVGGHLAVYRVLDGFARGGMLIFEIEKLADELCALSIYVAFNFARGTTWLTRPFWGMFRLLFPAYVHDVLWNHSLCQLKNIVEAKREKVPEPAVPALDAVEFYI
jgi:flavin-dependent dehydrogenase